MLINKNRWLFVFFGVGFLFLILFPKAVLAVEPFSVNSPVDPESLPAAIALILDIIFAVVGVVAVIYLIVGGFRYITAGGNAEVSEQAKITISNAIIGLVIVLLSVLIVHFVLVRLGFENGLLINRSGESNYSPDSNLGGRGEEGLSPSEGLPLSYPNNNYDELDLANAEHLTVCRAVEERDWRWNPTTGDPEYGYYDPGCSEETATFRHDNTRYNYPINDVCPNGLEYREENGGECFDPLTGRVAR